MDKYKLLKNKRGTLLTGLLTKPFYLQNSEIQQSIKELMNDTIFYISKSSNHLSVRNFIVNNNLKESDLICSRDICINQVKFRTLKKGFSSFCSQKCTNLDKDVQTKRKKTLIKNYGVEHALQNIDLNKKMKVSYNKTINLKYNNQHVFNQHLKNFEFWNDVDYITSNFIDSDKHFKIKEFKEFFNCQQAAANKKLKDLNIDYVKRTGVSLVEYELIEWLKLNNIFNIIKNNRSIINSELDLYLPDFNIAIEFNGIYWHSYCDKSSQNVSKLQSDLNYQKYHRQQKSIECSHKNINLFHIDENNIEEIKDLIILHLTHRPLIQEEEEIVVDLLVDNGNWLIDQNYKIKDISAPTFTIVNNRRLYDAGTITYVKEKQWQ